MALIVGPAAAAPAKIYVTQNNPLDRIVGTVFAKAGTVTGTAGVGSSLFLQRINLPAAMTVTEIQHALSIGFPATSQGAGTMSQSFAIFSIGNSTSLATLYSASGTSSWATGTSTAGAATSLTQYQGGWSAPFIQPMTFASSTLSAGDYVIGRLFDFAQASSTWTLNFYGANRATSLSTATLGALSSGGLAAVSAFQATTSGAITGFNAAISAFSLNKVGSTAALTTGANSSILATATAASTVSLLMNTGTGGVSFLSSGGLSAGSFVGTSGSISALTVASAQFSLPNFGFIGTGSTTSGLPTVFMAGIMSTGGIPSAITVTSTAVTYSGSVAFQQPWFALVGS
jgi:hypothetical protein